MNKYFIQLFLKESTVVLPGFGALTMVNARLNDIAFLPYLTYDDGKLANYIVETEGVDLQDAKNTIAKFIRELESKLNQGETFDIFEFGSFVKNPNGEIEFHSVGIREENTAAKSEDNTQVVSRVEEAIQSIATTENLAKEIQVEAPKVILEASEIPVVENTQTELDAIERIEESLEKEVEIELITPIQTEIIAKEPQIEETVQKPVEKELPREFLEEKKAVIPILSVPSTSKKMDSVALIQALLNGTLQTEVISPTNLDKPIVAKPQIEVKNEEPNKELEREIPKSKPIENGVDKPIPVEKPIEKKDLKKKVAEKKKSPKVPKKIQIERKRKFPYWIIIVLVLLVGIAVSGYIFWDELLKILPFSHEIKK